MKNRAIPESEIKMLEEIFNKIEEMIENHYNTPITRETLDNTTDVEHIHIAMYLEFMKDFIEDAHALRSLMDVDVAEFIEGITDGGKRSLTEVKKDIMLHGLTRMLSDIVKN